VAVPAADPRGKLYQSSPNLQTPSNSKDLGFKHIIHDMFNGFREVPKGPASTC
jgi:hypothetical protein